MNRRPENHSVAYRYGWMDGCYGEPERFTENRRLAELQIPSDRLDYYREHRAGRASRRLRDLLLEAS